VALFSQPTARALAILDLLMANPHQAFGLTEMTRRLNLNKATCHAILTTMATYGYLVQHPKTKAYRLGPSIIAAGHAAFSEFPVLEYARPELEALEDELDLGFGVLGRSKAHVVLLALYGAAAQHTDSFQLGLRLPNIAPLGAAFVAWSPAKHLETWLENGHAAIGKYHEKLDQRMRMSVISIRARGYEVTLRTKAEDDFFEGLKKAQTAWNLEELQELSVRYQQGICNEHFHLDRVDPNTNYEISNITVPVFALKDLPALCFAAGSVKESLSGAEIIEIAECMQRAAKNVTEIATKHLDTSSTS